MGNLLVPTWVLLWLWPSVEASGPHLLLPVPCDPPARSAPPPAARPAPPGGGIARTTTRTKCWRSTKRGVGDRWATLLGKLVTDKLGTRTVVPCPHPPGAARSRCCRRSSWAGWSATGNRWDTAPPPSLRGRPSPPRLPYAGRCGPSLRAQKVVTL